MAYATKLEQNTVRIVNTANGSTVRTIGGSFTAAVIQGEEVHLTQSNGKKPALPPRPAHPRTPVQGLASGL